MRFKQQTQLNQKCSAAKRSKLRGIPKLDDANDAGTKNSLHCTLILTEGDSAKTLATAGLGVVGRDRYGVFPLRGKVLNVREATHKQVMLIIIITTTTMAAETAAATITHGQWVTLSFCNIEVLNQTLNPTAELWCKTLPRTKVNLVLHRT